MNNEKIYHGDATELITMIDDQSVDMIFTDPPYIRESIWTYGWLAEQAKRVLKPDGFLMCYVGNYWKDEVMALIRPHMEYFWDYCIIHGGASPTQWNRKTIARTKAILCYRNHGSDALPTRNVLGAYQGKKSSKQWHTWGQDENEARYYIDCFTDENALILDPFAGGGTTLAAATVLGHKCIGFEKDADHVTQIRKRLAMVQMPLIAPQYQQLELSA